MIIKIKIKVILKINNNNNKINSKILNGCKITSKLIICLNSDKIKTNQYKILIIQ